MTIKKSSNERSWYISRCITLVTKQLNRQMQCIWFSTILQSKRKGPNTSIPVFVIAYCSDWFGYRKADKSAILGLTLTARHLWQMKQYFPRLLSALRIETIKKVCREASTWSTLCCSPQSWDFRKEVSRFCIYYVNVENVLSRRSMILCLIVHQLLKEGHHLWIGDSGADFPPLFRSVSKQWRHGLLWHLD